MFEVVLVQMPFAPLKQAPLALLQLQAALEVDLGDRVRTRIVYPSHDFGTALGLRLYHAIAYADGNIRLGDMSGLGDWFFRHIAFPELPDNTDAYRARYFSTRAALDFVDIDAVLAQRAAAPALLERVIDEYGLRSANLVGLTSMFAQHTACMALARLLKEGDRSRRSGTAPIVVIGGANCEGPMGQALADAMPCFDAVFSGPGLRSFPAFVRACLDGPPAATPPIRGVLTARLESGAGTARPDSLGEELDINVPLPLDYASFLDTFERTFRDTLQPVLTFETSRGCWWGAKAHCPFCGLNGSTMAYRAMAPPGAIALFERLFAYGDRCTLLECVDNIMPASYPQDVFPHLTPPDNLATYYEVKADLTPRDLMAMARAGIRRVQPGIEALSTPSLKALKKGTHAHGNVLFLKNCLTHAIIPLWNLLIGIPLEEQPDRVYAKYADDIPRLWHLPPPWAVFKIRIDRFSPYFVQPAHYGLALRPKEFYRFVYPFSDDTLAGLAYYFDDEQAGHAPYAKAAAEWHPVLHELVWEWYRAWHVRDPTQRPALFMDEEHGVPRLHDSRRGRAIDTPVPALLADTLTHLAKPTRLPDLLERLDGQAADPAALVAELRERQLLFEEGDRLLSLVHIGSRPICPAPIGNL
jgi:ribosomal peptide maturation radical SAM protein 1